LTKTLIVDFARRAGGANSRVLGALRHLSPEEAGLAVIRESPVTSAAGRLGITLHTATRSKYSPRAPGMLERIVRRHGYNILDSQNPISKLWACRVRRHTPCALVSTLNSWYPSEHEHNLKGRLYHRMELLSSPATDLFVAVSDDIRRSLEGVGIDPGRIAVVPNAIDISAEEIVADREELLGELGLPQSAQVCCAAGRMVRAKGYAFLLQVWRELRKSDTHCVIVGDGRERAKLERLILEYGLGRHVHLLGYRERNATLQIMKACDVFVMTSCTEGTPVALLEAAALRCPIVTTSVGGIPEMVTDGKHALLAEFGDAAGFASRVRRLLEERDFAASMAHSAAAHAHEKFSIRAQVDMLRDAWRRALDIRMQRGSRRT